MTQKHDKCDCMILNLWSCCNYGAIMTCWGVQCLLESLGKKAKVINYFPKKHFRDIYKNSFFEKFANENLNLTPEVKNYKDFNDLNKYTDTFIAGSDQIWNLKITANHCENVTKNIYLLDFAKANKKKLSYSASFGMEYFNENEDEKKLFSHYLNRFDGISIREDKGISIAKELTKKETVQLIDGAFCIPKEKIEALVQNTEKQEKYIGVFLLPYFKGKEIYEKEIEKYSKKLNLPIKHLVFNSKTSVEEWLSFIKNAEIICTDSYHAVVFSIIFNRPFVQIANAPTQNRFNSLYRLLNLNLKLYINENDLNIDINEIMNSFDWESINKKIIYEVEKSKEWLKNQLEKEKTPYFLLNEIITNIKIKKHNLNMRIKSIKNKIITSYKILKMI